MKRRLFFLFTFFLTVLLALSLSVQAQQVKTVKQGDYTYRTVPGDPLKTRIYKLNNGLTVYLTVYKDAPRLQTAIAVKAGSKYDPHDNTGLAHYLEHMLFKGTDRYGTRDWSREKPEIDKIMDLFEVYRQTRDSLKRAQIYHQIDSISYVASEYAIPNEYDKMLAAIGAKGTNAFTSVEQTVYINDIPANQIEKWLTIEAERFRNPVLRLFHTELEAVYEEKNRGLDSDRRKVYEALLAGLFQKHQYGTQTTIGTIEHLKNPSMKRVLKYFHTYYVPNNMAVCLSGDIDPDQTIRLIDQTLGKLKPSPIPEYNPPKEDPITKPIVKEVYGPDAENVMLAFRFPGANTREADLLTLTDMILMNSQAGLIDLNLNQKQKVIGAGSYASIMKDYSYHALYGRPRQGQTLEEVKDLLLGQLDLIKKGEFPDWLLQAVVNDLKLSRIRQYENNWGRAYNFVKTFTMDVPWQDYVFQLDRLSKFTKQDVIDFANQYYDENYVVVYKRVGVDKNVKKVKKPPITPVKLNRDDQSDFVKKIMAMPVKDIQPVFLDFNKDMQRDKVEPGIEIYYKQNQENALFNLAFVFDMGNNNDRDLRVALDYLKYLGTTKYTPAQIKQEFYKLGCSFHTRVSDDQTILMLTGLNDNFEPALHLFEHLLADAQPNKAAYENLVKDILKKRADQKLNKDVILRRAMYDYGKYGPDNPFKYILSEKELNAKTPQDLVQKIHGLTRFAHRVFYYGPLEMNDLKTELTKEHRIAGKLLPVPPEHKFTELPTDQTKIYFVNHDMKQAEVIMLSKDIPFNKDILPERAMFNEYYGGNMSSVVFQTMRESKALAYAVYATFTQPQEKDKPHYVFAYIGTQADKLPEAMQGFMDLLNNMPESQVAFSAAKEAIRKRMAAERITKQNVLFLYERMRKLGLDYDVRKDIWQKIPSMTIKDVHDFFNRFVKNKKYTILIIGNRDKIDFDFLNKQGPVKELSLKEIFGY